MNQSVRDRMRTQLSMRAPLPLLTLTIGALCPYVCVPSVVTPATPAQWHRMAKGGLLDGPDPDPQAQELMRFKVSAAHTLVHPSTQVVQHTMHT